MRFGSLFSGIGGLDLGLERAGMHCAWQVEIDPYCRRVLAKHWPNVPRWDDVRTFPPAEGDWGCDLIAGGFPCQDISVAGRGAGIDGHRSGLWREFARIVRELRPKYVLVENSPALLGRGIGRVLGDLAERGYDVEWFCLPAAAFGAPHLRWRLFLFANSNGQQQAGGRYRSMGREQRQERTRQATREATADTNSQWQQQSQGGIQEQRQRTVNRGRHADAAGIAADADSRRHWTPEEAIFAGRDEPEQSDFWTDDPGICGVGYGIPNRVDRIRGLGNSVVPQVAEWIGRRIMEAQA